VSEPLFDPERLLEVLVKHRVRFVIIGGTAARLWGSPVLTRDLDICYARESANLEALAAALREIGVALRGVKEAVPFQMDAQTLRNGDSFTFTSPLGDIDVLATPTGTRGFDELAGDAREMALGQLRVNVVSVDDLIRMKRAAGRTKDRLLIEELGALREELAKRERRRTATPRADKGASRSRRGSRG
jgi:hypothetical protein